MIQKFGRINLPFIRLGSPSNYHPTKLFENSGYKQFNLLNNKLILCLEDIFLKNAITTRQYSTPTHTKNSGKCSALALMSRTNQMPNKASKAFCKRNLLNVL